MHITADLHLHSKYSRAVSKNMILPQMSAWAQKKGIDLITASDWTHPLWFKDIQYQLEETAQGLYKLKDVFKFKKLGENKLIRFMLTVEVSSIYSKDGKTRRIHQLIFASSIEVAEKINQELLKRGANLSSDGRPIVGISASDIVSIVMEIDEKSFIIPCHIWTPWFSLYGSKSGFDSLEECYEKNSKYIYGIETGLSSDPSMNWEIPELQTRSILSFSDSHSLIKMGREATVFDIPKSINEVTFDDIKNAIKRVGPNKIAYTIEFYPQEGKYHFTGHRSCGVVYAPVDTFEKGNICPNCKRPLTTGVMERVNELSVKRFPNTTQKHNNNHLTWIIDPAFKHPPFVSLVPLVEIVAEVVDLQVSSQKVLDIYEKLCLTFGSELAVLLKTPLEEVGKVAGEKLADGLQKVRARNIDISPGFDGEFGKVSIFGKQRKEIIKN